MSVAPAIDVVGLGKRFGDITAVRDVTLRLRPGETLALIGGNGGGKTTTLRLLAGLLRPSEGTGQVLALDVTRAGRRIAAHAAYMPQKLALYPDLSVAENLRFRAALRGLDTADSIGRAAARFRLHPVLQQCCGTLSEGWARRVQLAATFLGSPPLVLLDEPTGGLDPLARGAVWDEIAALAAGGTAVVVSTHDTQEAAACTQVLVLLGGCVKARGAPAAVIAAHPGAGSLSGCLRALAGAQPMLRGAA